MEISEKLREEILSGKFDETKKLPSEHQLMRRFSVARETVRAALRDLLGKSLVDRKPGYGTFLSAGASKRTAKKLGLIVPQADVDFYWRICRGIEERAQECGWSILSAPCDKGDLREHILQAEEFVKVCKREGVVGMFVQPVQFLKDSEALNQRLFENIRAVGVPTVLIDSDYLPFPNRSDFDLVCSDSFNIGYSLAEHVIDRGARHIVYLSSPQSAPTAYNRAIGIATKVLEAELPWNEKHVIFGNAANISLIRRIFCREQRPDAVICTGDSIAVELLHTLRKIGLRVPEDVMIAGINGDPIAERANPKITTAVQDCRQIGIAAVDLLQQRILTPNLAPRTLMFGGKIIERGSTARNLVTKGD